MRRFLLCASLLALGSASWSAPRRGVGSALWGRMKPVLLAHIQRNIRENEGFFFIEDAARRSAFMGRPKRVYRKQILRSGRASYIVRVLFEEVTFDAAPAEGKSHFFVDFTLAAPDGRRWQVVDQALYAHNKRLFFKYDENLRRVSPGRDGVLTITIEREAPEEDETLDDGRRGSSPGQGPSDRPGSGPSDGRPMTMPGDARGAGVTVPGNPDGGPTGSSGPDPNAPADPNQGPSKDSVPDQPPGESGEP